MTPDTIQITLEHDDDGFAVVARWRRADGESEEVHSSGTTMREALENIHAAIQLALDD